MGKPPCPKTISKIGKADLPCNTMADVARLKKEWNACLAKSGGAPGRCEKIEKELRATSKAAGTDCCIDETVALMRCTAGRSRASGCASEFMAMRECNRAGGRQLVAEAGAYAMAPGKQPLFEPGAAALVSTAAAPARSLKEMVDFGTDYAQSLGIAPGEVRF